MPKTVKFLFLMWSALVIVAGGACSQSNEASANAEPAVAAPVQSASPAQVEDNGMVVYYFHGNMRCVSCRRIESYTKEAITTAFASDLADGRLEVMAVNVEEPDNRHFIAEFQLYSPAVVITHMEGGKPKQSKNLDRVWRLLRDKQAFLEYIQQETRAMMKGA